MALGKRIADWARRLKRDILALWIAARSKETPLLAKLVASATAAYALSPIDLIPDFIPVLGYADDLLIVPFGIMLATRLIPEDMMENYRRKAESLGLRPKSHITAILIVAIWLAALYGLWAWANASP